MADQGGGSGSSVLRDYRKGNWTVQETMILIEAKKMDDERRMKRTSGESSEAAGGGGGGSRNKPAELRWKWVEDYCWRKGCFRSQNQCNDKWDNLMRDYKRVRDYERRRRSVVLVVVAPPQPPPPESNNIDDNNNNNNGGGGGGGGDGDKNDDIEASSAGSYWKLEKNVRKDKNLPSNMLPQIYDALVEVVERKGSSSSSSTQLAQPQPQQPQIRVMGSSGGGGYGSSPNTPINMGYLVERLNNVVQPVQLPMPPPLLQHHHHIISATPMQTLPDQSPPPPTTAALSAPPPPPPPPPQLPPSLPYSQPLLPTTTMCDSSDSDTSEYSDSVPAKRRRKAAAAGEGTSGSGGGGGGGGGGAITSSPNEVGSAISKSASIIAEAIQACEEREERRHRELLSLHERRLKIEESKAEINRQGINGLVDAINKLANSILALASHNKEQSSK